MPYGGGPFYGVGAEPYGMGPILNEGDGGGLCPLGEGSHSMGRGLCPMGGVPSYMEFPIVWEGGLCSIWVSPFYREGAVPHMGVSVLYGCPHSVGWGVCAPCGGAHPVWSYLPYGEGIWHIWGAPPLGLGGVCAL